MKNHVLSITLFASLFCAPIFINAMEDEAIKPCSQTECEELRKEFEKHGCDALCRLRIIEKLATQFNPVKDSQFLRNLLCANKISSREFQIFSLKYVECPERPILITAQKKIEHEDYSTTYRPNQDFLRRAVIKGNMPFLKIFFQTMSRTDGSIVVASSSDGADQRSVEFYAEDLLKNEAAMQFIINRYEISRWEWNYANLACNQNPNKYPGCAYFEKQRQATENKQKEYETMLRNHIGSRQ